MGHTWEIKLNIRMVQALEALSQSLGGGGELTLLLSGAELF